MKKVKVAKTIERFIRKHGLDSDVIIYFSNKRWIYDSSGHKTIEENVKASDYFRWANDDTISMSFEGALNSALNMYNGYELFDKFNALDFDGYYFEMGESWNGAFYK